MTDEGEDSRLLHVPARDIPIPSHLSAQARATISVPERPRDPIPAFDSHDAWRAMIAEADAGLLSYMPPEDSLPGEVEERQIGKANTFVLTPPGWESGDRRICLYLHGGALILGAGLLCRLSGLSMANLLGVKTCSVDYRMPPDHPYPASLDDSVAVYRTLVAEHGSENIIVGGASAGGNLAAAMILRARDEGLPLPAAALLQTPEVDLTESGDSFHTLAGIESVLGSLMQVNLLYANGHDLTHPYLSPLFGDFTKGFPPTFLTTGTRDLYLSNTVRMHAALRAADVDADLYVMEAASHAGFPASPEEAAMNREIRRCADRHWGKARTIVEVG